MRPAVRAPRRSVLSPHLLAPASGFERRASQWPCPAHGCLLASTGPARSPWPHAVTHPLAPRIQPPFPLWFVLYYAPTSPRHTPPVSIYCVMSALPAGTSLPPGGTCFSFAGCGIREPGVPAHLSRSIHSCSRNERVSLLNTAEGLP